MEDRLERIFDLIRQRNGRVTLPRRVIVSALLESKGHLTVEELTSAVRSRHPDVHTSTVYRCLDTLERLRVVDHAHLGHGPAVYHLLDDPHQHLVCGACGTVIEVPDDIFEQVSDRVRRDFGFTMQPGHFAVGGVCAACSGPLRRDIGSLPDHPATEG